MKDKLKALSMPEVSLLVLLTVMPLIMTNGYFNITITKMVFFSVISAGTFALCYEKMKKNKIKLYAQKISKADVAMGIFVATAFVSVLFSDYKIEAILGNHGRFMGLIYVMAVFCAYVFITKFTLFRRQIVLAFLGSFTVVCVIAVIQYVGFDIFYLLKRVVANTRVNYISTMGNINVFSSFLCLGLPIVMYLFCFHRDAKERIFYFAVSVLGFYSLIISDTDSGYLGLCGAFVVLGILSAKIKDSLSRLFVLIAVLIFTVKFAVLISELLPSPARELSDIAIHIGKSSSFLCFAVVLIIVSAVLKNVKTQIKHSTPMKVVFTAVPTICALVFVGAIVWFSFFDKKTDLGVFNNYLRFSDLWGSERGHVWRITLEAFSDMPFLKKLIGCGPDTLLPLLMKAHEQQMLETGTLTDNAHNEYLQYLTTHGLIGLVSYLSLIFFSLKKCFYKSPHDFYRRSLAVAVCAYCTQAFFNISQPITTPIFFTLLFMTFSKDKDEVEVCDEENSQQEEPYEEDTERKVEISQ